MDAAIKWIIVAYGVVTAFVALAGIVSLLASSDPEEPSGSRPIMSLVGGVLAGGLIAIGPFTSRWISVVGALLGLGSAILGYFVLRAWLTELNDGKKVDPEGAVGGIAVGVVALVITVAYAVL